MEYVRLNRIRKEKIKVIYNPIEVEKIKNLSKEKVDENFKKDDEKLIIGVGRLVEQKDFETLIKAFKLVNEKINSKLIILGKGPLERKLKNLCLDLDLRKSVLFLGFQKNPYKFMSHSDLFVLSSKWEGFGHVIVEAMACGTPVLATDCKSGPREIIGSDNYGVLAPVEDYVELGNLIFDMLSNESKRKKYSLLGTNRSSYFVASKIVRE